MPLEEQGQEGRKEGLGLVGNVVFVWRNAISCVCHALVAQGTVSLTVMMM